MKSELQTKIDSVIKILKMSEKNAELHNEPVELAYSGGKDSDVLLQLAKESGINFKAYYKNTTIDPQGTIQHVKSNNVEIIQPKMSFFHLIAKKGFPSFRFRFCCAFLKEYKILNTALWGVRADESVKRKARYKSFNFCRVYNPRDKVSVFAPLFDWSLKNISDFILDRKIQLAPHYYDVSGKINFSRRLGCLGCPLKYDRGIADFMSNKNLLRAWLRAGQKFFNSHYADNGKFNDVYELFVFRTFFKNTESWKLHCSKNLFGDTFNAKEFISNYFQVKL